MGCFFEFNPTLEIDFGASPTCILGVGADAGKAGCGPGTFPNGFATPGAVSGNNAGNGMSIAVGDPTFIIKDAKQIGVYVEAGCKRFSDLLWHLGIRWDKDCVLVGGSDIANSRTFQELQAAAPFNSVAAFLVSKKANDYNKNFSQRVGFAYDLTGHGNHILRAGFGMYYGNTFQNIPLFMEQQATNTICQTAFSISGSQTVPGTGIPLSSWRFGVDPMPTIPPPTHNLNPGATGRIMDPNYRNPVTEEWNGGYTWSLSSKSVIEAEYVHVLSLHENKTINLDPRIPVNPLLIQSTKVTETAGGAPTCAPLPTGCGFFFPFDAAFTSAGGPAVGSVRDATTRGWSPFAAMDATELPSHFHTLGISQNCTPAT